MNNQQCFSPRNPHPQGLGGSHLSLCFFFLKYFALNSVKCNVYLKSHPGVYNFCFSSSSSLHSLAVSKLVLVCMGTNLVTHPKSVDGFFIPFNCLDYVKWHWNEMGDFQGVLCDRKFRRETESENKTVEYEAACLRNVSPVLWRKEYLLFLPPSKSYKGQVCFHLTIRKSHTLRKANLKAVSSLAHRGDSYWSQVPHLTLRRWWKLCTVFSTASSMVTRGR